MVFADAFVSLARTRVPRMLTLDLYADINVTLSLTSLPRIRPSSTKTGYLPQATPKLDLVQQLVC